VEKTKFTLAEKSMNLSVAGQDHASGFLQSQGDSSLLIHCASKNSKSTVIFGSVDKVTGMCSEEKWSYKWILHHGNAPEHDAFGVCKFLAKDSNTKMDHPPFSPDLAPCDFWLFPKLKYALKGQRSADLSDIQHNMKMLL
jgi:hypothetical protein